MCDGLTDGRTDRRTHTLSYKDGRTHLKIRAGKGKKKGTKEIIHSCNREYVCRRVLRSDISKNQLGKIESASLNQQSA